MNPGNDKTACFEILACSSLHKSLLSLKWKWKSLSGVYSLLPMDYIPPGFSVHGILQARILEWVAIPSSRGSSQPRDPTQVSQDIPMSASIIT